MNIPIWALGKDADGVTHTFIFGSSGKGRSVLLEAEAERLGISYGELARRQEPTDEQKEQSRIHEEAEEKIEEQRLQKVRQAIWDAWSDSEDEFSTIGDVLVSTEVVDQPSQSQIKAVFMLLPADIIGSAISWSFRDTEVGDRLYRFVEENKSAVLVALKEAEVNG